MLFDAAVETLTFVTGAYCVGHREEFWAGDATSGAYLLFLTLSDPDGYRMEPGGPATAAVAPAAREHGTPPVGFERETAGPLTGAGGTVTIIPVDGGGLLAGLDALIARTFGPDRAPAPEDVAAIEAEMPLHCQAITKRPCWRITAGGPKAGQRLH